MAAVSVVSDVTDIRRISSESVDVCFWRPILLNRRREFAFRRHGVLSGGMNMDCKSCVTREELLLTAVLALAAIILTVVS